MTLPGSAGRLGRGRPVGCLDSPMDRIELIPHAKVNLTLEVGPLMADGYHEIDSIAQVIDLADRLVIEKAAAGVLEVVADAPGVPSGPGNLVYRACTAFFATTGVQGGARCRIAKAIPAQAGLGGGSSDAAAALVGLDALYGTGLPLDELGRLSAQVGSDAAMFVYGGTVRMRGRGEIVEPMPDAPELDLVIVRPSVGVSTAWAYAELDKQPRGRILGATGEAYSAVTSGDKAALLRNLRNDFEPVVLGAFPEIREAHERLGACGADAMLLCGSGSAVFGVYGSREQAGAVADLLRPEFPTVFATRTLSRTESKAECR